MALFFPIYEMMILRNKRSITIITKVIIPTHFAHSYFPIAN